MKILFFIFILIPFAVNAKVICKEFKDDALKSSCKTLSSIDKEIADLEKNKPTRDSTAGDVSYLLFKYDIDTVTDETMDNIVNQGVESQVMKWEKDLADLKRMRTIVYKFHYIRRGRIERENKAKESREDIYGLKQVRVISY